MRAGGILRTYPELGGTDGNVEACQPPHGKEILKTIAAYEVLDLLCFKKRLRDRDNTRVACRQNSDELDVRCRFRAGKAVNRFDVALRTDHDVPGELRLALWADHFRLISFL